MVTADRSALCRRAVHCYRQQTYPRKELIVVDDGSEDLSDILSVLPAEEVRYVRIERHARNVLGHLRNLALDAARGDMMAQWDDDDWYHPRRLERQVEALASGCDACVLSGALMHLDTPEYIDHPYTGYLPDGVPGTIVHRREDGLRYPALRKSEDTVYLQHWLRSPLRIHRIPETHLFIRCFHGTNTWDRDHFLTRMRNRPADLIAYVWHRYVRRELFDHPRFRLNPSARQSFEMFLQDSRRLGLLKNGSR